MRGLLRLRNLVVIVAPAAALFLLAHLDVGDADVRSGVAAVILAPAPLAAPELLLRSGRRGDLAGAFVLGTSLLCVVLLTARPVLGAGAVMAGIEAFVIGSLVANAIPMLRDRLLPLIRAVGWCALAAVLAIAAALPPRIDALVVVAALAAFVVGIGVAAVTARVVDRDAAAAVGGSGLRDPAVGVAVASLTAGPAAAGVALVYAVFCLVLAAVILRSR